MTKRSSSQFSWYLDITPNEMFSLEEYPVVGKRGIPLCEKLGRHLEMKEVVLLDIDATEASSPDHSWVCE